EFRRVLFRSGRRNTVRSPGTPVWAHPSGFSHPTESALPFAGRPPKRKCPPGWLWSPARCPNGLSSEPLPCPRTSYELPISSRPYLPYRRTEPPTLHSGGGLLTRMSTIFHYLPARHNRR